MNYTTNPLTGRYILIKGPTYNKLVKEGILSLKTNKIKNSKTNMNNIIVINFDREIETIKEVERLRNILISELTNLFGINTEKHWKKGFTRWFFNANSDNEIYRFYPKSYESLGKYIDEDIEESGYSLHYKPSKSLINLIIDTNIRLKRIKNKTIPNIVYDKNKNTYNYEDWIVEMKPVKKFLLPLMFIIRLRYEILSPKEKSIYLSLPPDLVEEFGADVELFGSPFNTLLPYCSAFPDLENKIGSLGNYFKYKLKSNMRYTWNPPYDNWFMEKAAIRLIDQLDKTKGITVLISIPIWDNETRRKINLPLTVERPYYTYLILKESKYFISQKILTKNQSKFYNYFNNKYVYPTSSYLIIMAN